MTTASKLLVAGLAVAFLLGAGELVLRLVWGYGPEPRAQPHPTIEYTNPRSSEFSVAGRRVAFNAWGMRGPGFSEIRERLMVLTC